jgi:hypothetical protein
MAVQLNPDANQFQRNFVNEIKRTDELERKLRFFQQQVQAENIVAPQILAPDAQLPAASELKLEELEVAAARSFPLRVCFVSGPLCSALLFAVG